MSKNHLLILELYNWQLHSFALAATFASEVFFSVSAQIKF